MKMGKSIRGALSYNEQKVSAGTAHLLFASHFSRDVSEMGFSEKLLRFQKLTQLNEKCKTNTVHLSLNFTAEDKLDSASLQKIAADYMGRIGFGKQPYLVYQHHDTAHPHIHIVTTTIQPNGRSIFLHNIGRRKSEPARKAIEEEYGLVKAESRQKTNELSLTPATLPAAHYGKAETKRVVSNIVREVVNSFKYASLEELNAALRQYNVVADPGTEGTRMRQNKGLQYSLLGRDGNKIGVAIKASSIFSKPTLSFLEKRFARNNVKKVSSKDFVAGAVRHALFHARGGSQFTDLLRKNNIVVVMPHPNNAGGNIHFIDNKKKVVFTTTELGCTKEQVMTTMKAPVPAVNNIGQMASLADATHEYEPLRNVASELLQNLLATEHSYDQVSPEFLKKKRKKRRQQ